MIPQKGPIKYIYTRVFLKIFQISCGVKWGRLAHKTHTHTQKLSHTHTHTHTLTHTRTCTHTRAPLRCCSLSLDWNVCMEVLIRTNTRTRITSHTHTHIHTHRTQVCAAMWRHDVSIYTYVIMCMIIAYSLLYTCICSSILSYIRVYIYTYLCVYIYKYLFWVIS